MMVEVTQSDRQAARDCLAELAGHNWGLEYILDGMDDENETVQAFARHRTAAEQRGKLEGARLAIEAVLPEVVTDRTINAHGAHCRCITCELNIAEDTIRALSPAKIVGEG